MFGAVRDTMKLKTTIDDSIAVIEIEGSLSSEEKFVLEKELAAHAEKQCHVVLELSKVSFIDSASIGTIVKYYTMFRKTGRYLLLANISRQIFEVFNLTGITKQIQLFESTRGAIDFIHGKS
jgi:anti-anti-sigma factor